MQTIAYQLAEYKITEHVHGDLWWESHFGMGALKTGKCFIVGDILFIKPSDHTGPGFLKGEFLDRLHLLPKWRKTKLYCTSYKIYECESGRIKPLIESRCNRFQNDPIRKKNVATQKEPAKYRCLPVENKRSGELSYKLRRFEIIERNNDELLWKSHCGGNSLKEGRCFISGNILFVEYGETTQSGLKKTEFLKKLIQLPKWKKTKYFCTSYAIYYSETGSIYRRLEQYNKIEKEKNTQKNIVRHKTHDSTTKLEQNHLDAAVEKEKFKTLYIVCKILVLVIMKILAGIYELISKVTRALAGKLVRPRG